MRLRTAWHALRGTAAGPVPTMVTAKPDIAADELPTRTDPCPDCGCDYFTGGGQVLTHHSDGTRSYVRPNDAVLSCLGCGARWYGTPGGLRRPHEGSLPPAWAAADMHARAIAAQAEAAKAAAKRREELAAESPRPRGASAGFRRPPVPS